jgi:hypothetical protein
MSKVDLVVFAKTLNVVFNAFCSCQAFLALTLLNIRTKAPLRSFLAPVIRSLPPGWPLIDLTTFAAVLALFSVLL